MRDRQAHDFVHRLRRLSVAPPEQVEEGRAGNAVTSECVAQADRLVVDEAAQTERLGRLIHQAVDDHLGRRHVIRDDGADFEALVPDDEKGPAADVAPGIETDQAWQPP